MSAVFASLLDPGQEDKEYPQHWNSESRQMAEQRNILKNTYS